MAVALTGTWSGADVRALRAARRMSLREFAGHLGVSDRMVSKWEAAGAGICPRPVNQAALDTSLATAGPDARARFEFLRAAPAPGPPAEARPTGRREHVRHAGDGKLMALVEAGPYRRGPDAIPVWLPPFLIDIHPTTNGDYARFVASAGHAAPTHWLGGRCPAELRAHPVVFVTWHDAASYAAWAGKSLPGSVQWDKAARAAGTPVTSSVREWCLTETAPGRRQRKGGTLGPSVFDDAPADLLDDDTGFRCVAPA